MGVKEKEMETKKLSYQSLHDLVVECTRGMHRPSLFRTNASGIEACKQLFKDIIGEDKIPTPLCFADILIVEDKGVRDGVVEAWGHMGNLHYEVSKEDA
jgi:hypothetical protein